MSANDELWQRRFQLFVNQVEQEHAGARGWKSRLAERLGQDPSTINKLTTDARPVTKGLVTAAIMKIGIDPSFFYDPALGEAPDYHDFIGTKTSLDADRGTPSAEAYIAGQAAIGRPLSEDAAQHLRSLRHGSGDVPISVIESLHNSWKALREDRAVTDRPNVARPIDESRGQRRLSRK